MKLMLVSLAFFASLASAKQLVVFSDRPADRIAGAMSAFTAASGHEVTVVNGTYDELKARLHAGEQPDLILYKDIVSIVRGAADGQYQAMSKENRDAGVDATMRDPNGLWTAVAFRTRTIAYDPSAVDAGDVATYASLAAPGFKGQLCIRNMKDYMPTLVGWLIARDGEAKTREIVQGWRANLKSFTGGDTDSLKAIDSGDCAATISNQYYLARLKTADSRFPVELVFADQGVDGVHTNGFGGGIGAASKNVTEANALLAFLLGEKGSAVLVQDPSFEYPAVRANQPAPVVQNFGGFKASGVHWSQVAAQVPLAIEILESVGWAK